MLDKRHIVRIKSIIDDPDLLITCIDDLLKQAYDKGYDDGYNEGQDKGWCDCYDTYEEEING